MHFCSGLPIILVGCKKDLRRDGKTIDELRKTNQRPVTPEEVRFYKHHFLLPANYVNPREWLSGKRLELDTILNALHELAKVFVKYSNMPPVLLSCLEATARRRDALWCKVHKSKGARARNG